MICPKCGKQIADGSKFCTFCGATLNQAPAPVPAAPVYQPPRPAVNAQPVPTAPANPDRLPEQYKPLGAWTYWALSLLYSVPVVGFVFMIVFSFNGSNINRRSFTRSFWIWYLLAAIGLLITVIIAVIVAAANSRAIGDVIREILRAIS